MPNPILPEISRTIYNLEIWHQRRTRRLAETGKHDAFARDAVPLAIRFLKDYEQRIKAEQAP